MKTFILIFSIVSLTVLTFMPAVAADEKPSAEAGKPATATGKSPSTTLIPFNNGFEKFDVGLTILGTHAVNTELGTKRVLAFFDAFNEAAVQLKRSKVEFKAPPISKVNVVLIKFVIPEGKTLKTADINYILSSFGSRPADACESMSVEKVDPSILALELPVWILGTAVLMPDNKSILFQVEYASTDPADDKNTMVGLAPYIKEGNLWRGSLLIPVVSDF